MNDCCSGLTKGFLLFSLLVSFSGYANIAIIIDDVGYKASDAELLNLPAEITLSVLPHTPHGKKIAERAFARGQEVMLHLPMESIAGQVLEPGTINANMQPAQILQTLNLALNELPQATGVNNHMGSKLTQMRKPMQVIMQALKERNLFFVDSRTSGRSVAFSVAKEQGLVAHRRHVFLDNQTDKAAILTQLNKVLKLAEKKQTVIAIGHPHPETIAALHEFFQQHSAQSITLTKVSSLMATDNRLAALNSNLHRAD